MAQGFILEVSIKPARSELDTDHAAGATDLVLEDASDFLDDETGPVGSLRIGAADYVVTGVNLLTRMVSIAAPGLPTALLAGEPVIPLPISLEKWAMVEINPDDDPVLALVGGTLYAQIDDGVRDPSDQEAVIVEMKNSDWTVTELVDEDVSLDGALIKEGTIKLPDIPKSDGLPPDSSPTPTIKGSIGSLFITWDEVENPDFITYDVHLSTTSNFTPFEGTLSGSVGGTMAFAASLPDGTLLDSATTYYVRIVARDIDGAAPPGIQASGSPMEAFDQARIDAMEANLAQLQTDLGTAQDDLATSQTNISTLQTDLSGAQTTLTAQAGDIANLQGKFPIVSTSISDGAISTPKLAAGAITAEKIASGSITTEKLTVAAVGDNVIFNGNFREMWSGTSAPLHWITENDAVTGVVNSAVNGYDTFLQLVTPAGASMGATVYQGSDQGRIPSLASDQWFVELGAASLGGNHDWQVVLYTFDRFGAFLNFYASPTYKTSNASTSFPSRNSFVFSLPNDQNISFVRFGFRPLSAGATYYFDKYVAAKVSVSARIADGAITTNKMVANSISGDRIAAGTLDAAKIVAGSITTDRMTANSISGDRIAANTLDAAKITSRSITALQIQSGVITANEIATGAITANKILAGAIDGMTITGALVRTANTTARVEMKQGVGLQAFGPSDGVNPITLISATDGSMMCKSLTTDVAGSGKVEIKSLGYYNYPAVQIQTGSLTVPAGLYASGTGVVFHSGWHVSSPGQQKLSLDCAANLTILDGRMRIGTTSSIISGFAQGRFQGNSSAANPSRVTINHGLGKSPTSINLTSGAQSGRSYDLISMDSSSIVVEPRSSTGTSFTAATAVDFFWQVWA